VDQLKKKKRWVEALSYKKRKENRIANSYSYTWRIYAWDFYFYFYKSNPFDVRNDKESFVDVGLNNINKDSGVFGNVVKTVF